MRTKNMEKRIGKYFVIEGPGGSGKTEVIKFLKASLPSDKFFFVKEPDGPIREILLDLKNQNMNPFTELCLFTACRCELVNQVIIPKLAIGVNVVSDRNYFSSKVHQIEAAGRDDLMPLFNKMTETAVGHCPPDMYILTIAQIEELLRRKALRKGEVDKFDERDVSYQRKVAEAYFEFFPKGKPHKVIDTTDFPPPTAEHCVAGEIALEAILKLING